jgi:hypothetical protein
LYVGLGTADEEILILLPTNMFFIYYIVFLIPSFKSTSAAVMKVHPSDSI